MRALFLIAAAGLNLAACDGVAVGGSGPGYVSRGVTHELIARKRPSAYTLPKDECWSFHTVSREELYTGLGNTTNGSTAYDFFVSIGDAGSGRPKAVVLSDPNQGTLLDMIIDLHSNPTRLGDDDWRALSCITSWGRF